jgi:hypothetical protein
LYLSKGANFSDKTFTDKMIKQLARAFLLLYSTYFAARAQEASPAISPGANQTASYFPHLKNKKICEFSENLTRTCRLLAIHIFLWRY